MKHSEILKSKFTTVALSDNQYLKVSRTLGLTGEWYCEGYTDNKRDFQLDGWYYKIDLTPLKN